MPMSALRTGLFTSSFNVGRVHLYTERSWR